MTAIRKFQDLNRFESKFEPTNFNRLLKCIERLPGYDSYRKYLGKNLEKSKSEFLDKTVKLILGAKDFKNIENVHWAVKKLMDSPMYNFMESGLLQENEKKVLAELFWREKNLLGDYARLISIPESLESERIQAVEKILAYLRAEANHNPIDNEDIVKFIMEFNYEKFFIHFDKHPKRDKIFDFMEKNVPNYFIYNKNATKKECLAYLEIAIKFGIRNKLLDLKLPSQLFLPVENLILGN